MGKKKAIEDNARKALEMSGEAVRTDLLQQQTLPFAEDSEKNWAQGIVPGQLQNSVFVDRTESRSGRVAVVANTIYARRLYFHPEYNFYKGENPKAGGMWFEPYIKGKRKKWLTDTYAQLLRRLMK